MFGPQTKSARHLHTQKYCNEGECFDDYAVRYSRTLADDEKHFRQLLDGIRHQRILPGGRQQQAVGSPWATTAINCLSGDTLVLTREYGEVPIADVAGEKVMVCDGDGSWTTSEMRSFGEQAVRLIRFTNGQKSLSVKATDQHAWMVGGKRVTTADLRKGDRIDFVIPNRPSQGDEYRLGVVHGLVYGDGGSDREKGGHSLRLCGPKASLGHLLEGYPYSTPPSCGGDRVYYFFGENAHTHMKSLPGVEASLSYLLGFLRGWLATDGCVSEQPEVVISGGPEEESWIRRFGPLVGFNVTGSSALAGETNFGKRVKPLRNIRLDRRALSADDFLRPEHAKRFSATSSRTASPKEWRVASVSDTVAVEEVFCAVVPTTASFVLTGGLLSGNCFTDGALKDSLEDICQAFAETMMTLRAGGGWGGNFSTLRPEGDPIRRLGRNAYSSGPVSFMEWWDAGCKTIRTAGHRRGALMGVMDVSHPDILKFIRAKRKPGALTSFNISVGVTYDFMEALYADKTYALKFGGQTYRDARAVDVWAAIMESNWDWAEPGVLFIDRINEMNPMRYCRVIYSTNPCGEKPLPPYGSCLLGSLNLVKYLVPRLVRDKGDYSAGSGRAWELDLDLFRADVRTTIRAFDNVIENTNYPLAKQAEEARLSREIGLGVTGAANALEICGLRYGTPEYIERQSQILEILRDEAYETSIQLAIEKGPFPLFDADGWLSSGFAKTLPDHLRDNIRRHGLRNGVLLSLAPTGTISMVADNVSSNIEPPPALEQDRTIDWPEGKEVVPLNDYAWEFYGVRGRTAHEVSPAEHVAVLCAAQKYIDSAVSKTINCRGVRGGARPEPGEITFNEFKDVYLQADRGGAKGCTTYNANGKRAGIIVERKPAQASEPEFVPAAETAEAGCSIDPASGRRTCGD